MRQEIYKLWKFGILEISFRWRSKKQYWGRFGGGWNWELGFQSAGTTLILNLLIFSFRFYLNLKRKGYSVGGKNQ